MKVLPGGNPQIARADGDAPVQAYIAAIGRLLPVSNIGKEVIVTAKTGTQLPFDVGDTPTVFWQDQEDLKEGLRKRVGGLMVKYGR